MQAQHYAAFITAITLGGSSLFAQDLGIKAPPQTKPVAIVNAKIHTISGPVVEGSITFDKGVITDITPGKVDPPAGTTVKTPGADTLWTQEGSAALAPDRPVTLVYDNGEGLQFRRTISVDENEARKKPLRRWRAAEWALSPSLTLTISPNRTLIGKSMRSPVP